MNDESSKYREVFAANAEAARREDPPVDAREALRWCAAALQETARLNVSVREGDVITLDSEERNIGTILDGANAALAHPRPASEHPDDVAVDAFALAMKAKLAVSRAKGRSGWNGEDASNRSLSIGLRNHVAKGDPVDVANFAMFLHQRGEGILPTVEHAGEVDTDSLHTSTVGVLNWLERLATGKELRPEADTHAIHTDPEKTKFRKATIASAKANAEAFVPVLRRLAAFVYGSDATPRPMGGVPDAIPFDTDVQEILGRMCFQCISIAGALRKMGRDIEHRAEAEQAAVLHWLLGHYLKHGKEWRSAATAELKDAAPEVPRG